MIGAMVGGYSWSDASASDGEETIDASLARRVFQLAQGLDARLSRCGTARCGGKPVTSFAFVEAGVEDALRCGGVSGSVGVCPWGWQLVGCQGKDGTAGCGPHPAHSGKSGHMQQRAELPLGPLRRSG